MKTRIFLGSLALLFAGFLGLGSWQLQRLQWKEALIARVEERIHAAPVDAPGPARWSQVSAADSEYRHVQISGIFLHEASTLVQASTRLGGGYWVVTPLKAADGVTVLINRGFIPPGTSVKALRLSDQSDRTVTVTGLLRMSEAGGGFLRDNQPAADRWYSRDVPAIAAAHGLSRVAPYFIDADADSADPAREKEGGLPIGGLTVVAFPNNHLVYALTWYALALMTAGAAAWIVREERRNAPSSTMRLHIDSNGK